MKTVPIGLFEIKAGEGLNVEAGDLVSINEETRALIETAEQTTNKDEPDGYAGLDGDAALRAKNFILPAAATAELLGVLPEHGLGFVDGKLHHGDGVTTGGVPVAAGIPSDSMITLSSFGSAAENAEALIAAYAAAKALQPGGAALSATNRALLRVRGPFVADFVTPDLTWTLDGDFVDVVLDGPDVSHLTIKSSGIVQATDKMRLKGFHVPSGTIAYNVNNATDLVWEDLRFDALSSTPFHADVTTLAGTYRNIRATAQSCLGGKQLTVTALFENCVTASNLCFGSAGFSWIQPSTSSGVYRNCRILGRFYVIIEGLMERCALATSNGNDDAVRVGSGGKIWYSRLKPNGDGFSVGSASPVTAEIGGCALAAQGIHSNVTNSLSTAAGNMQPITSV